MSWQVKQRINFYSDEFRPPQLPAQVATLLLALGGSVALVLLLTLLALGYTRWESARLADAQWQAGQLQQQLDQLLAARPPLSRDAGLQRQQQQAVAALQASRQVLSYLTQGKLQRSQSFTAQVEQLGQQNIRGVWLQRFRISGDGVRLQGYLDQPQKLSAYIASLVQRPAYQGVAFRHVDVQKSDHHNGLIFELDSRPLPDDTQTAEQQASGLRQINRLKTLMAGEKS